MKMKKILVILSAFMTAVPIFAADIGSFGSFRFSGAARQPYSFKQKAFSVTDNLWNADAAKAQDKIGETADQVELFIGRIGESNDTKNAKRRDNAQKNATGKFKTFRNGGIALTAVGGGFTLLGVILLGSLIPTIWYVGIAMLPFLITGLGLLGPGIGCLVYSFRIGGR